MPWTALSCVLLSGCNSDLPPTISESETTSQTIKISAGSISVLEACKIADNLLGKNSTRSVSEDSHFPSLEYVMAKSAPVNGSDTLAYILNYPHNSGFAIISRNDNVNPVLAYSDRGNFNIGNEIAKANFIDYIEFYVSNPDLPEDPPPVSHLIETREIEPIVQIPLSQWTPWNKYVIKEHPECPAGCVAIATASILSHSQAYLEYYGRPYRFKEIVETIRDFKLETMPLNSPEVQPSQLPNPDHYDIMMAWDYMAYLISYIGKDVNMKYTVKGSGADSSNAYHLLLSLGCQIPSGYTEFNAAKVVKYLEEDCIVYMRGYAALNLGHAWVCDGAKYEIWEYSKNPQNIYLHCDWGWNGECNGYFSGKVFRTGHGKLTPLNYFAVKRQFKF